MKAFVSMPSRLVKNAKTFTMSSAPASPDRRRNTLGSRGQRRVPLARRAGVAKSGPGEFQRKGMRIGALADVLPVEDVLPELPVPPCRSGADVGTREAVGCRVCQREEGRALVV